MLEPLKDAFNVIARIPLIWLIGVAAGILSAVDLLAQLYLDSFFVERLWILQLIILPFFIGGAFGVIRERNSKFAVFFQQGIRNYFRILLPVLIVVFVSIITLFLVLLPLTLIGIPPDAGLISFITLGVTIPIAFFAFFYDTAAVFEEKKVFDSLRRSVEFIFQNTFPVVAYFFINILILILTAFVVLVVWTLLLGQQLEPLLGMNATDIQTLTPQDLLGFIGPEGVWITALLSLAAVTFIATLLTAYKASFFMRYAGKEQVTPGEYDEKGRWYKY